MRGKRKVPRKNVMTWMRKERRKGVRAVRGNELVQLWRKTGVNFRAIRGRWGA